MDCKSIKEYIREKVDEIEELKKVINTLSLKTKDDKEFDINHNESKLLYRCAIDNISFDKWVTFKEIMHYIKDNSVLKADYESAILDYIKLDIENELLNTI